MIVQQIFNARFSSPHEPRSQAYKDGVLYILRLKAHEIGSHPCPFPVGTAEADAWFSGVDEGHLLWRLELYRQQGSAMEDALIAREAAALEANHERWLANRDAVLYAEFNGINHAELAQKYDMSLRSVYKIIRVMSQGATPDDHQTPDQ